ncbi:hypothetical protein BJY01DRAFT_167346 [Aspergillus pseudoustus]|uniref:CorA-like transporter domain-containing protein n=1 Tax=Aspergillus pseudoustus TaxID=1810923 RepID=A0ABR4K4A2_9EURO
MYTVRYIEQPERPNRPWSVRRMGVYHKFCIGDNTSTWILLQPSLAAKKVVQSLDNKSFSIPTHVNILRASLRHWRWYLLDLDGLLKDMSEIARFSDGSDPNPVHANFTVAVTQLQQIQYIREQLQDALLHLDGTSETLGGLRHLWFRLDEANAEGDLSAVDVEHDIADCASRVQAYKRWTERSLQHADSLSNLIRTLLAYRQDEHLTRNTRSMTKLAECSITDSTSMLLLAKDSRKDSETMKLIAIINMLYLPATFVGTIFSTEFVGLAVNRDTRGSAGVMGVVFAVLAAILTVLTFCGAFLWQRKLK